MESLEKYLFKKVKVVDRDNMSYIGYVDSFTSAADNDDTEESVGIIPNEFVREGIELFSSQIKTIELVDKE